MKNRGRKKQSRVQAQGFHKGSYALLMSSPRILFISLILRTDEPIYIQSFDDNGEFIKYNFQAHMALDLFSSASVRDQHAQQQQHEQQHEQHQSGALSLNALLLFVNDGLAVYGHETRTGLKIVVGVNNEPCEPNNSDSPPQARQSIQPRLGMLMSNIFQCYMRAIFNPFNTVEATTDEASTLLSATFDKNIKSIIEIW